MFPVLLPWSDHDALTGVLALASPIKSKCMVRHVARSFSQNIPEDWISYRVGTRGGYRFAEAHEIVSGLERTMAYMQIWKNHC